ncbi:flagellar hook-basal body complex protein [bacterium BFN5]|nr:flagellar hook-basal body complex protein [bacterium BFN5]
MMRSLFSGISGLRNHQTRMDVIGNNIANVNTVGFKSSRVNFQDMLNQTIQGASSGQGNLGGTNPIQVGLGMGLASIDTLFTDGSTQPTGKQTDLAISGSGFFVLSDGMNQIYTRAGNFDFDNQGNYLVPGSGYKVMGWAGVGGNIDTNQPVTPIKIPVGSSMAAKPSTSITYANNLSGDTTTPVGETVPAAITVYDSKGVAHKISGEFTKTATDNTWSFTPGATTDTPGKHKA